MVSWSRRVRSIAVVLATLAMLLMAAQPVGAAALKFGSKLSGGPWFPSNAYPGTYCDHEIDGGSDTYACTWILLTPFNGGTATAPANGRIVKVKLINGQGGSFKLVVATRNASGQFKVTGRSTTINYSTDQCDPDCTVHKYSTSLSVAKGQYVGVQASKASFLRCDSGGNKIALFTPPLAPGGAYTTPTDYSGCYMLLQAVYST
jgi:hypothetical protein